MIEFLKESLLPPAGCYGPYESGQKERLHYIDLAKGICIMLVVYLHVFQNEESAPYLSQLRMPLYFFLSGLFFRRYNSLRTFVNKKANNLLIPFLFFELLYLSLLWLATIHIDTSLIPAIFIGNMPNNSPLWFLESLFIIALIYYFLSSLSGVWATVTCIIVSIGLLYITFESGYPFQRYIFGVLWGLPFYYLGNKMATTEVIKKNRYDKYLIPAGTLVFVGIIIMGGGNWRAN